MTTAFVAKVTLKTNKFFSKPSPETISLAESLNNRYSVSHIDDGMYKFVSSEADLEDVLLVQLRMENYQTTFLGDARNSFCVDLPPAKLCVEPARHTLLKHLACLSPNNTRKYRYVGLRNTFNKIRTFCVSRKLHTAKHQCIQN